MNITLRARVASGEVFILWAWATVILQLTVANFSLARPSSFSNSRGVEGHYSFSLTTFDTTGKLWQAEYATRTALEHTTVLAAKVSPSTDELEVNQDPVAILVTRQDTYSPLERDDGTPRFLKVNSNIMLTPAGLSADGRILMSEIQQLAIEYEYTFEEDIPLERLLEDLSLCMQRYTMKAGVRPFGCSILVTYLPKRDEASRTPQFYRVNPSGLVEFLEGDIVGIGNDARNIIPRLPRDIQDLVNPKDAHDKNSSSVAEEQPILASRSKMVSKILQNSLRDYQQRPGGKDRTYKGHTLQRSHKFLTATFSPSEGLTVELKVCSGSD